MSLPVTSLSAAILVGLFIFLSAQVIVFRRTNRVSMGDQGDPRLLSLMRAHGNFAEYTPFALLLLGLAEVQSAPFLALAGLGLILVLGRILHAIAFVSNRMNMRFRVLGMLLTFLALILGAALNLFAALT